MRRFGPEDGPQLVEDGVPMLKKPNPVYMLRAVVL